MRTSLTHDGDAMSTRFKIVTVAAALILAGAASMAVAAPSPDDFTGRPGVGGMMNGWGGSGWMMDGRDAAGGMMGAGAAAMHQDPEQMLEWHEQMHGVDPDMQRHMEDVRMATPRTGAAGSHCPGAAPPDA